MRLRRGVDSIYIRGDLSMGMTAVSYLLVAQLGGLFLRALSNRVCQKTKIFQKSQGIAQYYSYVTQGPKLLTLERRGNIMSTVTEVDSPLHIY